MNSRMLSYLGLATVAVIAVAWLVNVMRAPSATAIDAPLYSELQGKLDAVQAIKIHSAGDKLEVQLNKTDAGFVVQQRSYPADSNKVRKLLIDLESAKRREEKTSNPNNYAALNVQDIQSSDTKGKRLELVGAPVNLIIGKRDSSGRATYVRRVEDKTSWLTNVELDASIDPREWLQKDIVDIATARIAAIKVEMPGEKPYELFKKTRSDANYDVNGIPKGRELNSVSAPSAAAQIFTALTLDDVETTKNLDIIKVAGKATVTTFDGLVLNCTGYQTADVHWIAMKVAFDEALAKKNFVADPKATKEDADKALQDALRKSADESSALNKKLSDWAYAMPAHKFDSLFKPMEQLLKKKESKGKIG